MGIVEGLLSQQMMRRGVYVIAQWRAAISIGLIKNIFLMTLQKYNKRSKIFLISGVQKKGTPGIGVYGILLNHVCLCCNHEYMT